MLVSQRGPHSGQKQHNQVEQGDFVQVTNIESDLGLPQIECYDISNRAMALAAVFSESG